MNNALSLTAVATLAASLCLSTAQAESKNDEAFFEIQGQFELVQPPQPTASPDKVEVKEVFWYGCPHCFRFEPSLLRWEKNIPEYVEFLRMPAVLRDSWAPHARAYHTANVLGVSHAIHQPLYDAIHVGRQKLDTRESLMSFFAEHGVDKKAFAGTYDSFGVESKLRQSRAMTRGYGIHGVPAVVINGKYRTSGSLAGSFKGMLRVVDILVERERAAMAAN